MTAVNVTVADNLSLGPAQTETYPAASCIDVQSNTLVVTTATADGVYSFSASGEQTLLSPLPPYAETDPLVGLACASDAIYMLSPTALYTVGGGVAPVKVASLGLTPSATKVVVVPTGGTGGAALIVVGDTDIDATSWFTIDTGNDFFVQNINVGVTSLWDLTFSASLNTLVAVSNYKLWTVSATKGTSKSIATIEGAAPAYQFLHLAAVDPTGQYVCYSDYCERAGGRTRVWVEVRASTRAHAHSLTAVPRPTPLPTSRRQPVCL